MVGIGCEDCTGWGALYILVAAMHFSNRNADFGEWAQL